MPRRTEAGAVTLLLALTLAAPACGQAPPASRNPPAGRPASVPEDLLRGARPVGTGARFHLPVTGQPHGACSPLPGPRVGTHVEVFADNRVLLLPAGIGARPPRTFLNGRVTAARCYGALATLDPTGLVLVRPGARLTLAALFRSWGQRLSAARLASFTEPGDADVSVFVNGRAWHGAPQDVPLSPHAEIVLEIGPYVPPHASYTFPPGT